jgi:hypothetical protein
MGPIRPTGGSRGNASFLGNCDGWEMGIEIQTDYYEALSMKIIRRRSGIDLGGGSEGYYIYSEVTARPAGRHL